MKVSHGEMLVDSSQKNEKTAVSSSGAFCPSNNMMSYYGHFKN
jgi:hypothetical protein